MIKKILACLTFWVCVGLVPAYATTMDMDRPDIDPGCNRECLIAVQSEARDVIRSAGLEEQFSANQILLVPDEATYVDLNPLSKQELRFESEAIQKLLADNTKPLMVKLTEYVERKNKLEFRYKAIAAMNAVSASVRGQLPEALGSGVFSTPGTPQTAATAPVTPRPLAVVKPVETRPYPVGRPIVQKPNYRYHDNSTTVSPRTQVYVALRQLKPVKPVIVRRQPTQSVDKVTATKQLAAMQAGWKQLAKLWQRKPITQPLASASITPTQPLGDNREVSGRMIFVLVVVLALLVGLLCLPDKRRGGTGS